MNENKCIAEDEFYIEDEKRVNAIPCIHWVNYLSSPTMKVRLRQNKIERSRSITQPAMNTEDPKQVRELLELMVKEGRKLVRVIGSDYVLHDVTDENVAAYVGRWKGTRNHADRIERAMRQQEYEYVPIVRKVQTEYVPSPLIDVARQAVQRCVQRYQPRPALFEYVNIYGEKAAVPML